MNNLNIMERKKNNESINIFVEGPLGKIKISFLKKRYFYFPQIFKKEFIDLKDLNQKRCYIKKDLYKSFLNRVNEL